MTTSQQSFAHLSPEQAAAILGIMQTANPAVVHAAYRAAARRTHPDMGGSTAAFDEVRNAYNLLLWQYEVHTGDELPAQVQDGPVVWARTHVRAHKVAYSVATAGVLVGFSLAVGSAALAFFVAGMALLLLVGALLASGGKPSLNLWQWRQGRVRDQDRAEWETGPIPAMTDERIREYEQTGR